jgi:hypothetical protein
MLASKPAEDCRTINASSESTRPSQLPSPRTNDAGGVTASVGVGLRVTVAVGVRVGVRVGVAVAVDVAVDSGPAAGVPVAVLDDAGVMLAVGVAVGVPVGVGNSANVPDVRFKWIGPVPASKPPTWMEYVVPLVTARSWISD